MVFVSSKRDGGSTAGASPKELVLGDFELVPLVVHDAQRAADLDVLGASAKRDVFPPVKKPVRLDKTASDRMRTIASAMQKMGSSAQRREQVHMSYVLPVNAMVFNESFTPETLKAFDARMSCGFTKRIPGILTSDTGKTLGCLQPCVCKLERAIFSKLAWSTRRSVRSRNGESRGEWIRTARRADDFLSVKQQRVGLYSACAAAVFVPATIHKLAIFVFTGPLMVPAIIFAQRRPKSVEAAKRCLLVSAEVAQAVSSLLLAIEIIRVVNEALLRTEVSIASELCKAQDAPLSETALLGDPAVASRVVFSLVFSVAALHVDRVLCLLQHCELARVSVALDTSILVFLIVERSFLSVPFCVHVCLESTFSRLRGAMLVLKKQNAAMRIANMRAVTGAMLSLSLLFACSASFKRECRGPTLDAALVFCVRVNTALFDTIDVFVRVRRASTNDMTSR